jgi:hypothetical protein
MEEVVRYLKATPNAHETLSIEFKSEGWIDHITNCSEEQLYQCALERIRQDQQGSQFSTFLTMLHDTPGLNEVANKVEQRWRECGGGMGGSPSSGEP